MPTVAPDSMSAAASCALMIFDFSRTHWIRSSLIGHPRCPSFAHEALGAARPVGGPPQQRRCNAIGRAWNDLKQTGGLEQGDPGRDFWMRSPAMSGIGGTARLSPAHFLSATRSHNSIEETFRRRLKDQLSNSLRPSR